MYFLKFHILKCFQRKAEEEARTQQLRNEQEAILLQIQKEQFQVNFRLDFSLNPDWTEHDRNQILS